MNDSLSRSALSGFLAGMGQGEAGVTRRWLLKGVAGGCAAGALVTALPAFAHGSEAPRVSLRPMPRPGSRAAAETAEQLIGRARLGGKVAYLVVDAHSGEVLEQAGADVALPPASTAKTLTTAYALETLGATYRFVTRLIATGPVENGELQGDLVLAGGGDPTLLTDDLGDLAVALKKAQVTRISGRFLVADGALPTIPVIDPTQPVQEGYDPGISGINLNFNRLHFGWKKAGSGWTVVLDARGTRFNAPVTVADIAVVDRRGEPYTYTREGGVEHWTVASWAMGHGGNRWLPVRAPAPYAADVFRALAADQGIRLPVAVLTGDAPAGTVLASHQSDELRTILRVMLKYSTNVTAEIVGLTSSIKRAGPVDSLAASAKRMTDWAKERFGINVKLIDHSGLGIENRATPADFVRLLRATADDGLRGILKPIPLLDYRGRLIRNSPIKVAGKTGTLDFVSNLIGFETTPKGRDLVFAILSGDVPRSEAIPAAARARPRGVLSWTRRAHMLQQGLLERWASVYDGAEAGGMTGEVAVNRK